MQLKRLYHRVLDDNGLPVQEYARDAAGDIIIDKATRIAKARLKIMRDEAGAAIVRGVLVERLPLHDAHKFSPRLIEAGKAEGWLTETDKKITIHCALSGNIVFKKVAAPGRQCNHCGLSLPGTQDDPSGSVARRHVADEHPDAGVANDYDVRNYYLTKLEA